MSMEKIRHQLNVDDEAYDLMYKAASHMAGEGIKVSVTDIIMKLSTHYMKTYKH